MGELKMLMKDLTLFFMFFRCLAHSVFGMHHITITTLIIDLIPSCTESEMH